MAWPLCVAALLICGGCGEQSQLERTAPLSDPISLPDGSRYVRILERDAGRRLDLEIAIRTLRSSGLQVPDVHLVAAMHIAEADYYEELQGFLDAQEIVLFEGIGPAEGGLEPDDEEGDRAEGDPLQKQIADSLGLVFQLEAIDYDRPGWRNSDMRIDEVEQRLAEAGVDSESLFAVLTGESWTARVAAMLFRLVGMTDFGSAALKLVAFEVLARADELLAAAPGEYAVLVEVLIPERNQVVMDDLGSIALERPAVETVAIFYGAGHMLDLEQRLTAAGYRVEDERWVRALRLDIEDLGVEVEQARSLRAMIRENLDKTIRAASPPTV